MSFNLSDQEVSKINSEHIHSVDKLYRMHTGVGSNLLSVKDDTMVLEVNVNDKWLTKKTLEETSIQFLNSWKDYNKILQNCKYYIVYIYKSSPLGFNFDANSTKEEIPLLLKKIKSKEFKILLYRFSNKEPNNFLNKLNISLNRYPFETNIYKIYLDLDMVFYSINYDSFIRHFVYKEEDFHNRDIKGIPCFLKLPISNSKEYLFYPKIDVSKFFHSEQYAILTYKNESFYSTKAVLTVENQTLNKIEIYEKRKFSAPKLLGEANADQLKTIGFIK
jgi:hypothetical protein